MPQQPSHAYKVKYNFSGSNTPSPELSSSIPIMTTREWHTLKFNSQPMNPSISIKFTLSAPAGFTPGANHPPMISLRNQCYTPPPLRPSSCALGSLCKARGRSNTIRVGSLSSYPPRRLAQSRDGEVGIEYEGGQPLLSVDATLGDGADWSLMPLLEPPQVGVAARVTIEVERDVKNGVPGTALKIFVVRENGQRFMARRMTTAFWETEEDGEMWVGAFAARPAKAQHAFKVKFEGLKLHRRERVVLAPCRYVQFYRWQT